MYVDTQSLSTRKINLIVFLIDYAICVNLLAEFKEK